MGVQDRPLLLEDLKCEAKGHASANGISTLLCGNSEWFPLLIYDTGIDSIGGIDIILNEAGMVHLSFNHFQDTSIWIL